MFPFAPAVLISSAIGAAAYYMYYGRSDGGFPSATVRLVREAIEHVVAADAQSAQTAACARDYDAAQTALVAALHSVGHSDAANQLDSVGFVLPIYADERLIADIYFVYALTAHRLADRALSGRAHDAAMKRAETYYLNALRVYDKLNTFVPSAYADADDSDTSALMSRDDAVNVARVLTCARHLGAVALALGDDANAERIFARCFQLLTALINEHRRTSSAPRITSAPIKTFVNPILCLTGARRGFDRATVDVDISALYSDDVAAELSSKMADVHRRRGHIGKAIEWNSNALLILQNALSAAADSAPANVVREVNVDDDGGDTRWALRTAASAVSAGIAQADLYRLSECAHILTALTADYFTLASSGKVDGAVNAAALFARHSIRLAEFLVFANAPPTQRDAVAAVRSMSASAYRDDVADSLSASYDNAATVFAALGDRAGAADYRARAAAMMT